jgi:hypothetical protein
MNLFLRRNVLGMCLVILVLLFAGEASAQVQCNKSKRLRGTTTERGFIGGEAHNCYTIRARQGQTLTVEISWRREGDNRAEFSVSRSLTTSSDADRRLGRYSNNNRRWTGKIRTTRNYYIDVVGYPTARYTLKVTLR